MMTALLTIAAVITGALIVAIVLGAVIIISALAVAYPAETFAIAALLFFGYIVGQSIFGYLGWL